MTKQLIIIILVIALIYYHQNYQNERGSLAFDKDKTIPNLKDLGAEEALGLKDQKIADLEAQLISLAKQKLVSQKEAQELVKRLESYSPEVKELEKRCQAQLRKINLLFDSNAANYQWIDFDGLYSLLEKVKAESEALRGGELSKSLNPSDRLGNTSPETYEKPLSRKEKRKKKK